MKSSILIFVILAGLLNAGSYIDKDPKIKIAISDKESLFPASSARIMGYLGERSDLCIKARIMSEDPDYLVEPFRHREETRLWQTEFWGKWIQSAIAAYDYNHDPALLNKISEAVTLLIKTQTPDGYIGNYSSAAALQHWDIWGRKYTLLGLLAYVDLTGDKNALAAARKLADHLLTQVGPGKADIVKTGDYRGMPSSSILEPMVSLYRHTGEPKYLDFARYIVADWETPSGPRLISAALSGVPVSERFPHPSTWWSYENGQKAYEMMSCYDGLLDLYRVTGEPDYLKAVEAAVKNIIKEEINIAGSGTAFECFYNGAKYQTEPTYHTMETCVTMTWMKLCFNLLRVTGDPQYADQIEISVYNALMASMKYDGSMIAKYSPLAGIRHDGEEQCGMHINCCNANGPRAFMMLPRFAVLGSKDDLFVNLYTEGEFNVPLDSKNKVSLKQSTDYPVSGKVEITLNPEKQALFGLSLRIPSWSMKTVILLNGDTVKDIHPGSYCRIAREWKKGDRISIEFDMRGRLITIGNSQAISRGPVVLSRDVRFRDGYISEPAVVKDNNGYVDLKPHDPKPANLWMAFTAPLILGTDLEGEFKNPRQVAFCDFASAGNTWGEESRYSVWIPRTLNVMKTDYKGY
jgi:uncharacterized protein